MRRLRRTKIVATLGPSSSDQATIARLFEAGADVFRINMSHTSHDAMRKLHAAIRAVEKASGRPIGILADLQGPKLRVGTFKERRGDAREGRDLRARRRQGAGRRDARAPAASRDPRGARSRPHAAARRRQGQTGRDRDLAEARGDARRGRRQALGAQGREPARHDDRLLGADRQGPLRSRSLPQYRRRLGGAVVHPAARGHRGGQEDHARPRRRDGQDREAAGGRRGSPRSWTSPTR